MADTDPIRPPDTLRHRFERLTGHQRALQAERDRKERQLDEIRKYLDLAPQVDDALELLGQEMFGKLSALLESNLTLALQEVLGQAIKLKVVAGHSRGSATLEMHIERDGQPEDIMKGTGGSVANILSVGLRLFALARLDEKQHRRFLVLDEQDCWLSPDLVPKLVKIIRDAGQTLGFQVIMISHHSPSLFRQFADRIYEFTPTLDGVKVEASDPAAQSPDAE